ncbi:hypothetical protein [Paraburkholderia kururiensis]|uniref:Transmembrane protein n=1 Tax=Paraburkholderia kururiensis TaxID=984307 RepID=A0ABZ0WV16_9BURK|nr:hypothetical protein [Paraburkholderia kururiensis]WQD81257.1 hypothetical protein U0042_29910 [Paraburkholderia kururiensis]
MSLENDLLPGFAGIGEAMNEHRYERLKAEYQALLDQKVDRLIVFVPHHERGDNKRKAYNTGAFASAVEQVLGKGRTWPLKAAGRNADGRENSPPRMLTPEEVWELHTKKDHVSARALIVGVLSLVLYGVVYLAAGFGSWAWVAIALLADAVLLLPLVPRLGKLATIRAQLNYGSLWPAASSFCIVGAALAAGLTRLPVVLITVACTLWLVSRKDNAYAVPKQLRSSYLFRLAAGVALMLFVVLYVHGLMIDSQPLTYHGSTNSAGVWSSEPGHVFFTWKNGALFIVLAALYLIGAWASSIHAAYYRAREISYDMQRWMQAEMLKHGEKPTEAAAWANMVKHESIIRDEFKVSLEKERLLIEFVLLLEPKSFRAIHEFAVIALWLNAACPAAALFVAAYSFAINHGTVGKIIAEKKASHAQEDADEAEARRIAMIYQGKPEQSERGMKIDG